eukprot:gnl/TRDRNA2_/TRDRNA2_81602_c0_seq2.p1 gnl/TRDRNA2_/TRDRNA2_81602_c0~~gnl/TRDRNA2_/TRDRNA2_81602_c0_seq2.p1  ORF type:complete len:390 (+),score=56.10 gnl/TRDRNA2_/TRDRNA2_81602_c0_seq2:46-1215(+)
MGSATKTSRHRTAAFALSACLLSKQVESILTMRKAASDDPLNPHCVTVDDPFEDLKDAKIYALVYYGRRSYIDILNAYLERNLRVNGGVLTGVIFAMVKYTIEDLNYLVMLQRRNPDTYIIPWNMEGGAWDVVWRLADEPGAYYIKIDDDVTYIADGAIPEMIREKRRGRFLFVSANVINHGILSAVHQELGAIPHLVKPPIADGRDIMEQKLDPWVHQGDVIMDPNYRIEHTFYSDCVWRRWDCAALVHEALLFRLETNTSCLFDFGIFDFHSHGYETMHDGIGRSIDWNDNFFAFKHEDFDDIDWDGVANDDEREMSTLHPKRRQEHAGALGRAIIAHWTFSIQEKGLLSNTTLLERYRARAEAIMAENAEKYYKGEWQPRGHIWER